MTTTTTGSTAPHPTARFAGWTGVGFAIVFVAGFLAAAQVPAYDAPDAEWVNWVENDNVTTVIGALLLVVAGLMLMAFVTSLASHVRGVDLGGEDHRVAVLRGAGVIAGATLMISALVGGAMSAGVTFAPEFPAPGAEILRSFDQLSVGIALVGTGWSMALTVALASWLGRRSGVLPGWLATGGMVVAVLLLLSPMFLPIVFLPLWAVVTGIVALRADR